jgi:hypothetical protein
MVGCLIGDGTDADTNSRHNFMAGRWHSSLHCRSEQMVRLRTAAWLVAVRHAAHIRAPNNRALTHAPNEAVLVDDLAQVFDDVTQVMPLSNWSCARPDRARRCSSLFFQPPGALVLQP